MPQAKTSRGTVLGRSGWRAIRICQRPRRRPIGGQQKRSEWMSAAEQLEDGRGKAAPSRDALMEAEAVIEAQLATTPVRRARLRPLLALAPYIARYRWRAMLAFISLTIAAVTTLIVP